MRIMSTLTFTLGFLSFLTGSQAISQIEDNPSSEKKEQTFLVADGKFQFSAPNNWKKIKPKYNFFEAEFQIPKSEGDEKNGRLTFSRVRGTIGQNLERWVNQFQINDKENAIKEMSRVIEGTKVKVIHINGTFMESAGGPVGPKTERENYVLMGAAIETGDGQNVYIKAYGPKKTMNENHDALKAMLENMKVSDG